MIEVIYHVYTISPSQAKKQTVAYLEDFDEVKELCRNHVLYAYEKMNVNDLEPKI